MKRKQASIGKILLGVLGLYLLVACIGTCIFMKIYTNVLEEDFTVDKQRLAEVIDRSQEGDETDTPERVEKWWVGRLNVNILVRWLFLSGDSFKGDEAHLAVYDEQENKWIAKSGCAMTFKEAEPLKNGEALVEQYGKNITSIFATLYVKDYLTDEQIAEMINDDDYGKDTYSVQGYYKDGEIIPKQLQRYEITRNPKTDEKTGRKLVTTYTFDVSKEDEKNPTFEGDSNHFFLRGWKTNRSASKLDFGTDNKAIIDNPQEAVKAGGIENMRQSIFRMRLIRFEKLKTAQGAYWLSSYVDYRPLPRVTFYLRKAYLMGFVGAGIIFGIIVLIRLITKPRGQDVSQ